MFVGSRFQAEGAATENELSTSCSLSVRLSLILMKLGMNDTRGRDSRADFEYLHKFMLSRSNGLTKHSRAISAERL